MTIQHAGIPPLRFNEHNQVIIEPSPTSAAEDFNFLQGKWQIHNSKLRERLAGSDDWDEFNAHGEMNKILGGVGNIDSFSTLINGEPFEGMTLRLFDPVTRLWSIYWADNVNGKLDRPVIGSFKGNLGFFYTHDLFREKEIIMAFRWDKTNPQLPAWSQAFSADNGITWEWNWHMHFSRP